MKPKKILDYSDIDMSKFIDEHIEFKSDVEVFIISSIIFSRVNTTVINKILEIKNPKEEKLPEMDYNKLIESFDLSNCISLFSFIMKLNNTTKVMTDIANNYNALGEVCFYIVEQNKKLITIFSDSFLKVMTDFDNINEAKNILNDNITKLSYNQSMAKVLGNVIHETDILVKDVLNIALNHVNNKHIIEDKIALIDVNPKQTEIIIALNELGILDFLRDKHPHLKMSQNRLANIIHLITGNQTESLVSNINTLYSPKQKQSKNNPYSSERVVKKVKDRLDKQLKLI